MSAAGTGAACALVEGDVAMAAAIPPAALAATASTARRELACGASVRWLGDRSRLSIRGDDIVASLLVTRGQPIQSGRRTRWQCHNARRTGQFPCGCRDTGARPDSRI